MCWHIAASDLLTKQAHGIVRVRALLKILTELQFSLLRDGPVTKYSSTFQGMIVLAVKSDNHCGLCGLPKLKMPKIINILISAVYDCHEDEW